MSKFREDRVYEVMGHLSSDPELKAIYEKEIKKSNAKYPRSEFFTRMEKCYEKAIKKHENIQR